MFAVRSAANSLNAIWRWSVDSDDKQWNRLSLPDAKIPIPRDAQTDGFLFGRGHIFASGEQVAGNVQETSGWVLVFPYLRTQRTKIASSLVLRRREKGGWEFGMLVTRAPFWQSAKCMANFALDIIRLHIWCPLWPFFWRAKMQARFLQHPNLYQLKPFQIYSNNWPWFSIQEITRWQNVDLVLRDARAVFIFSTAQKVA